MNEVEPATEGAYRLFHEGAIALATVEKNGMRVDMPYLQKAMTDVDTRIANLERELKADKEVFGAWRKRYGQSVKLGGTEQLTEVLFKELGYPYDEQKFGRTNKGKLRADEDIIRSVKIPFTEKYLEWKHLSKARNTYLSGLWREVVDGYVHPSINLHTVETFRSSESDPNLQNQPNRDPMMAEIIRKSFIWREGNVGIELDFAAHEFRVAAIVWADPDMLAYATNPKLDIHWDVAARAFALKPGEVEGKDKGSRHCGKNGFVFPRLYGSDYIKIAQGLWNSIEDMGLQARPSSGPVPMRAWLARKGIKRLGDLNRDQEPGSDTFELHVKKLQEWFDNKFPTWRDAREPEWQNYVKSGWFRLVTGFVCRGVYSRNQFMNFKIQGPSFHCLLWSLIRLQKELKRLGLKCLIVNQIHDCLLLDCPRTEVKTVVELASKIMAEEIRKEFTWLSVPLGVEAEIATPTWWDKKPLKL